MDDLKPGHYQFKAAKRGFADSPVAERDLTAGEDLTLNLTLRALGEGADASLDSLFDTDDALPAGLWDPMEGRIGGGVNYSEGTDGSDDPGTSPGEPAG